MDIEAELTRIFAEDELGLFDVKPKKSFAKTADQRLIDSFEEINAFVAENGYEHDNHLGYDKARQGLRKHDDKP